MNGLTEDRAAVRHLSWELYYKYKKKKLRVQPKLVCFKWSVLIIMESVF